MACRHHQPQMSQSLSIADLSPPLPTIGATDATGIDRSCLLSEQQIGEHGEMRKRKRKRGERKRGEGWKEQDMSNPFSFSIDVRHKLHRGSDELRSTVLDGFPEMIDPSKRRGKHEEMRKRKGKRGERKRGGWKGQELPIPFSFTIDVGHKLHRDSDELRCNVLDGFPEKIDPSKRRGKHEEMRKRKGKRGERKRGEGWKGQDLLNPFSFFIDVGHKLYKGSSEPRSNVLDDFPKKIDPSKEKEKHKKLNYLRKPEKAESSTSSSVEEVKRVLGHLFMKATAEELKVLQNVFDSGSGSNSWMAAFKNEIDKQERSLKANLLGESPRKLESRAAVHLLE